MLFEFLNAEHGEESQERYPEHMQDARPSFRVGLLEQTELERQSGIWTIRSTSRCPSVDLYQSSMLSEPRRNNSLRTKKVKKSDFSVFVGSKHSYLLAMTQLKGGLEAIEITLQDSNLG